LDILGFSDIYNTGGYLFGFLGGSIFGPLWYYDIMLIGIVICLIFAKFNWEIIHQDKFLLKFLFFLSVFAFYYLIMYGGIVPYFNNDFNYSKFIMKHRNFVYGFIILIATYIFSLRGLYHFYTTTLFIGVISLTLYFVSLLTGLRLIPIVEMARYEGNEMTRIAIGNYGLFFFLFPLSLITYLISRKINLKFKFKYWLYYSGVVMLVSLLLTLTRRTQIDIIGGILIIILM